MIATVTHWRSRFVHPWRYLHRWFLGTPDRDIAVTFIGVGCLALLSGRTALVPDADDVTDGRLPERTTGAGGAG